MHDVVTSDFKFRPYWWEAAPPVQHRSERLEAAYDVAIVGSGFTGASAAVALARAGRSVAIFDKDDPGAGASRRSAGFLGRALKKSFSDMESKDGTEAAREIYAELGDILSFMKNFVEEEGIDCFFRESGRFIGATSVAHYRALEANLGRLAEELGYPFHMVPHSQVRSEMATDAYHGGAVIPDNASLHPGLYHKGLLDLALAAGAHLFGRAEVLGVSCAGDAGCEVSTSLGPVRAREVIIATNGYTPPQFGWLRRRLVPFRAYMAATEELPADLLAQLIPNDRTIIDSNHNIDFFRTAPDSPRLLFGGATAAPLDRPEAVARRMKEILDTILPAAGDVRLSHAWDGYCAGTFDLMPHMESRNSIHYGAGYNFVGIGVGTMFGQAIAKRILREARRPSVFEKSMPSIPFYTGSPWFLGLVMKYFDWKDRRLARGG